VVGAYAYTPAIWLPLAGAILLAAISLYCWRRRDVPAARPLAVVTGCAVFWLLGIAFEVAAVTPATKIAWFRFQAVWRMPTVTADLCFFLEYAYPGRWLTRRNLILLSIPVLADVLLVVSGDAQLIWQALDVLPDGSVMAVTAPAGLVLTAYGVGLVLVNSAILLWLFVHSPQHRWPVALMLGGQLASRVLSIVDAGRLPWPAAVDPLTIGLLLSAGAYAIALFGFRIFDPVPAARTAALEQMRDGMVVFDPQWRIVDLNRAAAGMVGASRTSARGVRPAEVLPEFGDLSARLAASGESFAVALGSGPGARSYEADVSALRDFRNVLVGYLLLLRDVTERRRAEVQILEQQRSLAMLRERELLARELHDGIGQVMGYASLQLEVVQGCITDGLAALSAGQGADVSAHLVEAENHVTRLSSVVEQAHADVREHILNLRVAPSRQQPFLATLRHYLDGFSQNYGIKTELSVGTAIEVQKLDLDLQMQLFRIIQEALSNARRHAGASCVQVSFEMQDGRLCAQIRDDGRGFDPARAARGGDSHLGLHIMHERAEQIGGRLAVQSAPGAGTCVQLDLPLEASQPEERR
jgi:signal transduction histidine kinase